MVAAIGFDTETHLFVAGNLAPPVVCLTVSTPVAATSIDTLTTEHGQCCTGPAIGVFDQLLDDSNVQLIGLNGAYDLTVLGNQRPERMPAIFRALDAGRIRDVSIREQLLAIAEDRFQFDRERNIKPKFSLAELVLRYFNVDLSQYKPKLHGVDIATLTEADPWRVRYAELDGIPASQWPPAAYTYAIDDAHWTVEIHRVQGMSPYNGGAKHPLVHDDGAITDEDDQTRAAFALHLCSTWGLRVDPERAREFERVVRLDVAKVRALATAQGFLRADTVITRGPNKGVVVPGTLDTAVLKGRVLAAYRADGRDVPLTKTGQALVKSGQGLRVTIKHVSTSAKTLKASGDPVLIQYATLKPSEKLLSTYVPQLYGRVGRPLTHGYRVLVRSGRTSASNPNTQNPPRDGAFRECFVPMAGNVFISTDYDSAELKALAQIQRWWFGCSALGDAINAGLDPHLALACELLAIRWGRNVEYSELLTIKQGDALYDDVYGPKGARQLAKIANFGFPGGLSAKSFIDYASGYDVTIALDEAKAMRAAWLRRWPEMALYFKVIGLACEAGPFTALHPISNRQRGGVYYTQACNGYFQGLVADFAKRALYEVTRACFDPASPLFGYRPVLFIHDEIILEGPAEPARATAAADEMTRIMLDVARRYCPDINMTGTPAMMFRWYKGAKEVRDPVTGYLLPWEPKISAPKQKVQAPDEETEDIDDDEEYAEAA